MRAQSAAEAHYVQWWCERQRVACRVRRIDEFKRGVTARDEYEREARNIRFGVYADVCHMLRAHMRFAVT
jgi:hypothetical protein